MRQLIKRILREHIENDLPSNEQEEKEGVGAYAAPAFEMEPDHEHFKHENNESEITERCWKGYTQKGMKTMFGKRYPNCVKIKKKRVNESKIVDYLKRFVDFKNDDPKKQFQKIVDVITKITLKDNPVDGMIGVAVTHVNKEMWGQNFNDSDSIGTKWNFKVIIRPLFHKHIADMDNRGEVSKQLLQFEDEFIKSAKGMGFELISPVTHKEINQYSVKFEFAHVLVVK